MPQTLLSIAGLLIVTLLSFSQQQANMRSQQQAIRAEYQQMALGVAKQSIEVVRTRDFDQALDDGETDVENFTERSDSEWGEKDCIDDDHKFVNNCSAVEHFHDDETMAMENADGLIVLPMPGGTVRFEVEFEVHYAEEDDSIERTSDGPTGMKEVTVRVQDCQDQDPSNSDPCDGEPLLPQPIVFSEVFSYSE